jgi:hypothetical protein
VLIVSLGLCVQATRAQAPSAAITYKTIFQDPGVDRAQDLSLANHAISVINTTPRASRSRSRCATSTGVLVEGVIDGGEREQALVKELQNQLGP